MRQHLTASLDRPDRRRRMEPHETAAPLPHHAPPLIPPVAPRLAPWPRPVAADDGVRRAPADERGFDQRAPARARAGARCGSAPHGARVATQSRPARPRRHGRLHRAPAERRARQGAQARARRAKAAKHAELEPLRRHRRCRLRARPVRAALCPDRAEWLRAVRRRGARATRRRARAHPHGKAQQRRPRARFV